MSIVLSTKTLDLKLKRHLFAADIDLVDYNAIKIQPHDISFSEIHYENAIFSSQNAVRIAVEKNLTFETIFCVGKKTAELLASNNRKPSLVADNSKSLAQKIIKGHSEKSFDFFCSAQRRDELPDLFTRHKIEFREHHIYKSVIIQRQFKNEFDAVLCFSPLGVKAYYENHSLKPKAICIGETTAHEARKFTRNVLTSNKTSLESVVVMAVRHFGSL